MLLVAIPVFRVSCKVGVDRGRGWSAIEELVLWAVGRQSKSVTQLSEDMCLPHQIVVAAIARLMRFRLVEVAITSGRATFRASDFGFKAISSGNPLPFYPTRVTKRANFVIEWITGEFYHTRDISLMPSARLEQEKASGTEIRVVSVEGGGPSMSHEANLRRLSELTAGGWNEEVALVDGRTAVLREDEYMVVRIIDGIPRGLPERAGATLRRIVSEVSAQPRGTSEVAVGYSGLPEAPSETPIPRVCDFDPGDLIIGGSAQRTCFLALLGKAERRAIIHSTFLDAKKFELLIDPIQAACQRGVVFDLLWGAEADEETEKRNFGAATKIARIIRSNPALHGRVRMHMRTTGSHAKLILLDTNDGWVGAIGSCNWLSSPFQAVELSMVVRDGQVIADIAIALQRMVGRRGLADSIANEMAAIARDLRRSIATAGGNATIAIVVGGGHEELIRTASGSAERRFFVGSNRLGSTARPGAIMQGEVAASREGVRATVLYTQQTGPVKKRHTVALKEEALVEGVQLVRTRDIPLHGKVVAWDENDIVVTSLNWASASINPDFPWADIGIHVHANGVATDAFERLLAIFPELRKAEEEWGQKAEVKV